LSNGDGTFTFDASYAVNGTACGIGVGDLDGDGDKDLAIANSTTDAVSILLS
jgi:hypothetical protein